MSNVTLDIHFVRCVIRNLPDSIDSTALLQEAGIAPQLLQQPKARVTAEQYAALSLGVIREMKDECLGYLNSPLKPGTFAMLVHCVVHNRKLGHAIGMAVRFLNLFDNGAKIEFVRDNGTATFRILETDPARPFDRFFFENAFSTFHQLFGWLIGSQINLDTVRFRHAQPPYVHEYSRMFSCTVEFNHDVNEFVMCSDYLEHAIVQSEVTARELLTNGPLKLLQHLRRDFSHVGRIKALVANDLEHFPEFEDVAQQLHMTPRTLRRHLRREGRSYQEIKNDIRRDAAIYYLTRKGMTIASVAEQTGFSDTSTFIRAFKAWTGVTPYVYRKQVEGADVS
jgi:AraC-like DNA-binding protein